MNTDNLLILHVGITFLMIGTQHEINEYCNNKTVIGKPLQWNTSTPAEFGTFCFDIGWDAASYETFA